MKAENLNSFISRQLRLREGDGINRQNRVWFTPVYAGLRRFTSGYVYLRLFTSIYKYEMPPIRFLPFLKIR